MPYLITFAFVASISLVVIGLLKYFPLGIIFGLSLLVMYFYALAVIWLELRWYSSSRRENEIIGGGLWSHLDGLADDIRENSSSWLYACAISILAIRVAILLFGWLKHGYWEKITLCSVELVFCEPTTKLIGFNRLIQTIGGEDFVSLAVLMCWLLGWLFGRAKSSRGT
jgi:hypothetical protein